MALPKLTPDEKRKALRKAREMRSKRAEIRRGLKDGRLSLIQILNSLDDEAIARMRVVYLLESLPRIGKATTKKIMQEIGIDRSRRVQGLGNRQRGALLEKLG
ncbi:MAG: integration host factor [Firmicutes bacterium]|nr:integration host factor [Bacillota bacterium]